VEKPGTTYLGIFLKYLGILYPVLPFLPLLYFFFLAPKLSLSPSIDKLKNKTYTQTPRLARGQTGRDWEGETKRSLKARS
jgi:hypothetical protein